jgi:branched-chain amino acid transport system permease protein
MSNFFIYLLLGLGTGAAYALLANGVVAIYKGSGVLNFGQGAIAMLATYCYVGLIEGGMSKYVALVIVTVGAAASGALLSVAVFRPIRNAPVLAKVVVTLGLLTGAQGLAALIWGNSAPLVPSLFPTKSISLWNGVSLGEDRIWMLGVAIVIGILLWAGFRYTRLGLATEASSENERGAALLGYSPTLISASNWALGSALAAIAGAMIAPLTGLDQANLPLVVLPALAAALAGRFSSFGVTTIVAIALGCIQTELLNLWSLTGVETAAPFVIVIVLMVAAGRGIPTRGTLTLGRPPFATKGVAKWYTWVIAVGLAVLGLSVLNATYQSALATSLTMGVVALSLVVITGYVGQVSLMQLTFAGLGGFFTAKLGFNLHIPFPLPLILSAMIVAPIGAMLGTPALRVRGLSLAVITLGAAVAIDAVGFQNQSLTGGAGGVQVVTTSGPVLFGFSLDPFLHPMRFGTMCLIVLMIVGAFVGNLRRSATGRRMLAVRDNERAAAVAGIDVRAVKLQAFTISSVIAALGGGLLAYFNPYFELGTGLYGALPSISLLALVYIGGIGSISGAVFAGIACSGGVIYQLMSGIGGFDNWYTLVSGVGVIWTVMQVPDGVAVDVQRKWQMLLRKAGTLKDGRSGGPPPEPPVLAAEESPQRGPAAPSVRS